MNNEPWKTPAKIILAIAAVVVGVPLFFVESCESAVELVDKPIVQKDGGN